MLIDIQAIRQAAKNKASTPCYPANAANGEKQGAISRISNVSSVSKVAGVAVNDFQAPEISRISNVSKVAGGSNTLPAPVQSVATVASSHEATATPKRLPKFHIAQPWNALDRDFQVHYWQCPACKAGGRTRGPLCPQGQPLSAAVDQAFAAA